VCTRSPASLFIGRLTSVPQIDVRRTDCRHSRCSERASVTTVYYTAERTIGVVISRNFQSPVCDRVAAA